MALAVSTDGVPLLTVADLPAGLTPPSGLTVEQMVDDATALAVLAAPCLGDPLEAAQRSAVKAILRGAILRWSEAGSGAMQSEGIGPYNYTVDNRQQRRGMFWPSEIKQLQGICAADSSGAFSVDTAGPNLEIHADTCALRFGATYCSCGADIAGFPLFGA